MHYLFLTAAFVCNGLANILLKIAALKQFSFSALLHGQFTSASLYAASAVVLFAFNLGFYLVALERIPLSVGYPVMVGMTFFLTIAASLFLGERINLQHALGITLILVGILLIVRFASA